MREGVSGNTREDKDAVQAEDRQHVEGNFCAAHRFVNDIDIAQHFLQFLRRDFLRGDVFDAEVFDEFGLRVGCFGA